MAESTAESPKRSSHSCQQFGQLVSRWQQRHGRHDLPWQRDPSPWRVWVSEVMLQQTTVTRVMRTFDVFMARFPAPEELACASHDEVMHAWDGMGYYRRAANLHAAAKRLTEEYGGQVPSDAQVLQSMPGIGPSTAHAIACFGFGQPLAILDANAKRVYRRVFDVHRDPALWDVAVQSIPTATPQAFNQGMMDLGATVCMSAHPECGACPCRDVCHAHDTQVFDAAPVKSKPAKPVLLLDMTFCVSGEHVLLVRRTQSPWRGLWAGEEGCLRGALPHPTLRIELTHRRVMLSPHVLVVADTPAERGALLKARTDAGRWAPLSAQDVALPVALKRWLRALAHARATIPREAQKDNHD